MLVGRSLTPGGTVHIWIDDVACTYEEIFRMESTPQVNRESGHLIKWTPTRRKAGADEKRTTPVRKLACSGRTGAKDASIGHEGEAREGT